MHQQVAPSPPGNWDGAGGPAHLPVASDTSPFRSVTHKMCVSVQRGPGLKEAWCRLGHRADGWGLQDQSGIKGHSFLTGVCWA